VPFQSIGQTGQNYGLISFDQNGIERIDDGGERFSGRLVDMLRQEPFTDVFFMSHGWKGDVVAAIDQYDRWFGAMESHAADAAQARQRIPGFRPLRIGLHWPSQPWGNEEQPAADADFDAAAAVPTEIMVERYVERLGDSPKLREALRVIFDAARTDADADVLPPHVAAAYRQLNDALEMGEEQEGAAPGDDREPFDPHVAFDNGNEEADFGPGGSIFGGILGPLRQLSFWKMKDRARKVGEGGMHGFLIAMQGAASGRNVRFHLMGHSFGCIVVSSMLRGPGGGASLARPVDSVALVQGALSLWSFCPDIPDRPGKPGYFHDIVKNRKVNGPLVTTHSRFDTAVGRLYPIAAGIARQVDFAPGEFPTYGGLGTFGARGLKAGVEDRSMLAAEGKYDFKPGTIYNLESSKFIAKGDGASGAHSDIDGLEVAHALWQAALTRGV
jgi:hypothetical protein